MIERALSVVVTLSILTVVIACAVVGALSLAGQVRLSLWRRRQHCWPWAHTWSGWMLVPDTTWEYRHCERCPATQQRPAEEPS